MNDDRERPTTSQPLNAEKRSPLPILWVILTLAAVLAIFALIGYLRYQT